MLSFVPIRLKFSTRVKKYLSAKDKLNQRSLNVLNGAILIDLVTLLRWSIASRRTRRFSVRRFCVGLKYSLFAIIFATRRAIFAFDPTTASTAFLRYCVLKTSAGV